MRAVVPIVIPAYEPEESFCDICDRIAEKTDNPIIVVNDGSGHEYDHIFERIARRHIVLRHAINNGKGRALKTAFNYVLNNYPDAVGVITADSDGQHTPADIVSVMDALVGNPDKLILGVRDFDGDHVPRNSKIGNKLTRVVCSYLCGVKVSDTQTGLRGIPTGFMRVLMNTPGERFEFETNMLLDTKDNIEILEVPIETVYESKDNHKTHFDPVKDSIRIYRIFGRIFIRYLISAVSSFVLDIAMFAWLCPLLKGSMPVYYVAVATVIARIVSSTYNFAVNYRLVFDSKKSKGKSAMQYFMLALFIMGSSALLTTLGVRIFAPSSEAIVKVIVDSILFLVSYKVQQKRIF